MDKPSPASLALATAAIAAAAATFGAAAAPADDINALRQEMQAIRADYEARLQALEQRLKAAESATAAPAPATASAPVPATAGAGANAFNPAISLILSGLYTRTSRDPAGYAISGFRLPPGAEIGPGSRGLRLAESELGLAASIDPWWRGAINIALHGDDAVSVEEAFVQTTAFGNGIALKAGRFFSNVGYLNPQHAHTWDFVDNPLAYQAMLGTQYGDDGVQLSWIAPIDHYVELGAEVGRGRSFPGSDSARNGAGMTALTAHTGGDLGDSHNWRAGLSVLNAKARDLTLLGQSGSTVFNGSTRVWIADAVWKWAPNGNATRTNFKLQGEYLRSARSGSFDEGAGPGHAQSGWYLQGIYQFMPRWRLGLRTERLDPGNDAVAGFKPRKNTLMVDFSASEFSRLRLQLAQDRAREGPADKQLFIQYQMSLGAHGAHSY